jgi:hypothetical protein
MLRKFIPSLAVVALLAIWAGPGYGSPGGGKGHADPSCSASPNPAAVGQSFTLSAVGLPTIDPIYLIVQSPSGDSTVTPLSWLGPNGSWSGHEAAGAPGVWTYTFSGLMQNRKYGAVATCTEQVN